MVVDVTSAGKLVVKPEFREQYAAYAAIYGRGVEHWPLVPALDPAKAFGSPRADGNYEVDTTTYRELVQMQQWRLKGNIPLSR